ncbi:phosphoglucosamine mutase [Calidifontibacter sp. DB0510]|uniref:Phosphoglucosamine mutase n=1 Tax=Metallococcus carri TaxID=1656884 RepID=A0A967EGJ3_9MICO|nr:phosphoglucosamine mutase [Metallococcus carri]NHN55143.1 phosphoglucosamine mutase [Metallococcus carri]NOP36220.1 phosphoglucosamine mutase [Calidifontibacter sp. DB2511S]
MARLFGTDGVRGLANGDVITADLALKLSEAAAKVFGRSSSVQDHRPTAVVGRDPRASGEFLAAAVAAGLASSGIDVYDVGVLPTPAVAFLTADLGADFGVMLSASHNAMPDNGIKFFARGGHKLPDEVEDRIEAELDEAPWRPTGAEVGRVRPIDDGGERYVQHLVAAAPYSLTGLHVVVDAAHGAASTVGPEVLRRAGARVTVIGAEPDGLNINDGYGSTHLDRLMAAVPEARADLGVAFDGDADRCLAVDAAGQVVDGDQIMAILAIDLKERGELAGDTLVATTMSNLGLLHAMRDAGVHVVQANVGDRYVLEEMRKGGFVLGGEQSGHVIQLAHGTTGDGVLTALVLAARVAATGKPLADLAACMTVLPQKLVNVKGVDKHAVDGHAGVLAAVGEVERQLGDQGRVLLRKSGTEPVVRVMVEAPTAELANSFADHLAGVVQRELAL